MYYSIESKNVEKHLISQYLGVREKNLSLHLDLHQKLLRSIQDRDSNQV